MALYNYSLDSFRLWLLGKNYNSNTVKNYIADVNKYIQYINPRSISDIFSEKNLTSYLLFIISQKNSHRYLTSLTRFTQYASDQNIIRPDLFKKIKDEFYYKRNTSLDPILHTYQKYLSYKNMSLPTIKNYINDIHQFIGWLENNPS